VLRALKVGIAQAVPILVVGLDWHSSQSAWKAFDPVFEMGGCIISRKDCYGSCGLAPAPALNSSLGIPHDGGDTLGQGFLLAPAF